jgi:hypothetical protein
MFFVEHFGRAIDGRVKDAAAPGATKRD